MSKCDIKTSGEAWNDGVDAFKKAFKQTGGDATKSINYAIGEVRSKYPNLDFDIKSFSDPITKTLKDKGLVKDSYKFVDQNLSKLEKEIDKISQKMQTLSPDQKKTFARKAFSQIAKKGDITDEAVKNLYAEAVGIPAMTPAIESKIGEVAKANKSADAVEQEIKQTIKEMQEAKDKNGGKLSEADDKKYEQKFSELTGKREKAREEAMAALVDMGNLLEEKRFWLHNLGTYMPLNLMNPNSLIKNVSGAIADTYIRTIGNTMASPISEALKYVTGVNSNPIGARLKGATLGAKIRAKARMAWKFGKTEYESEIPQSDILSVSRAFDKAMKQNGLNKFTGLVSAALKVHPELISKGLSVPDALVYEMVIAGELERVAQSKGLSGAEKQAFLMDPDEKSMEIASAAAKKATFKQDLPGMLKDVHKWLSYDPHESSKKLISEGRMSPLAAKLTTGLLNIGVKSVAPFVKTPINILRVSTKMLLPEYELGHALVQAHKETDKVERQRLIVDGVSRATAGFMLRYVAIQMFAKGLMSAGYDDEEYNAKDAVEQETGGPNRINLSAFIRGMTTLSGIEKRKGDIYIDFNALGAKGIALSAYAGAWNTLDRESLQNETDYSKNLLNVIGVPSSLALSQISSTMDFTFMTGFNSVLRAIQNEGGYDRKKLGIDIVSNFVTSMYPSTLQKFSTQWDPNVKRQFDKDLTFTENLQNALGYRFAFQSEDLKNKYFSLKGEKGIEKKKQYMLFDNYLGRVLESEFDFLKMTKATGDDNPVSRLYMESRKVEKDKRGDIFPSSVSDKISINTNKRTFDVQLTNDQHEYLMEQASNYRTLHATPYIMSDQFNKDSYETKIEKLKSAYSNGLKQAKADLKSKYPEIMQQKIEGTEKVKEKKKSKNKKKKTYGF